MQAKHLRTHTLVSPQPLAIRACSARVQRRAAGTVAAIGLAALGTLAMLAAPPALAADTYIGLGLGTGRQGLTCADYDACDRTASGSAKAFVGLETGPHLGVEVMAWRLGEARGLVVPNGATGLVAVHSRSQGLALSGVARTQIDAWTLRARLGVGHVNGTADMGDFTLSDTRWALVGGLGASYALDKRWSLHADWDRLPTRFARSTQARADLYTLGVSRRF